MTKNLDTSISFDQIQELISCIYDAALDENHWKEVLNTLSISLKAEQGNLRIFNTESLDMHRIYTFNKDPDWIQA